MRQEKSAASTPVPCGCAAKFFAVGVVAFLGLVVLLIPFSFISFGVYRAVTQDRLIRTARPVAATVIASQLGDVRGRRGLRSNVPVIVFRYEVAGQAYQSDCSMLLARRGTPRGMTRRQFVAAYSPGSTVYAYYVPGEPRRAFLVKAYSETPYVDIYIGLGILGGMPSSCPPPRRRLRQRTGTRCRSAGRCGPA